MKAVTSFALALAVIATPVQAQDLTQRELFGIAAGAIIGYHVCLLYTSPSPRDRQKSRMPSSA